MFLKLFEKGLAYQKEAPINFCPSCKTGLANEEVTSEAPVIVAAHPWRKNY